MTGFIPPYPVGRKQKLNPLSRFLKGRYNLISAFYEKSYDMKLGEVRAPHRRFYFANHPDLANEILKDPVRFPKSDLMGALLDQLLGQSIFITNGDLWKRQRMMMAPAFEHARVAETFEKMVEASQEMIGRMAASATGDPFLVDHEMAHVTADIIFRTIFSKPMTQANSGIIFDAFTAYQELAYAHGVWTMAGIPQSLSISRLRARKHSRAVRGLLEDYVNQRLEDPAESSIHRTDILQSLIDAKDPESGEPFTKSQLVDQVGIMFLAGHETSASALSWALYLISNVPEVATKMQAEADEFWAAGGAFRKLRVLKHTRDVFRETLRLYPPVAMLPRDSSQPETMRGKEIPKDSIIFVSPWLIHRQRKDWQNPDMFAPDRFSDPAQAKPIRDNYLPFSKGPRVCLGASFALQEAVIILSAILHRFDIQAVPDHIPRPVARLTLRPENGVSIRLSERAGRGK